MVPDSKTDMFEANASFMPGYLKIPGWKLWLVVLSHRNICSAFFADSVSVAFSNLKSIAHGLNTLPSYFAVYELYFRNFVKSLFHGESVFGIITLCRFDGASCYISSKTPAKRPKNVHGMSWKQLIFLRLICRFAFCLLHRNDHSAST